ncbi:hypothetical protein WKV44_03035 [Spirochaetia bacterium 38H-sp]|uniref:Uncharacterized protein n=1 Tax=Rarispira pelagica TaxID=3141764 RepID=A0ABU9UA23_9SPIR
MKRVLFSLIILLLVVQYAFSQEISQKKEIAIFQLENAAGRVPKEVLSSVYSVIQETVFSMGRFEIAGYSQTIDSSSVEEFIDKIREYKEVDAEIPEEVLMGQAAFTEADFKRLVSSFIIIIPRLTFFELEKSEGVYTCTVEASITVYNVEDDKIEGQFKISGQEMDESRADAVNTAVSYLGPQLEYELRKVFVLRSTIIDVDGGEIYLEFGKNMGIMPGDEFALLDVGVSAIGKERVNEGGLLLIKEVQDDYSVAIPLYVSHSPVVGDQIKEVPRTGIEFMPYFTYVYAPANAKRDEDVASLGMRFTATRGFFATRPTLGIEAPLRLGSLITMIFDYLPIQMYIGAEVNNIYLGRLQISPTVVVGLGGLLPLDDKVREKEGMLVYTHLGGKAFVSLSYLITRDIKIAIEPGFTMWFGMADEVLGDLIDFTRTYYGPSFSFSVVFK